MAQNINNQILQAQECERRGDAVGASRIYQEVLSHEPRNAAALHALGVLLYQANQLEKAFELFSSAVQSEPLNPLYQRNLGELCRRIGRIEQSILCGKAASKLDPKNAEPQYNLGLAYNDAGDIPKAITAYRKAVKLNPQHGFSWNNLGSALESQGNKKSALAAYEKAVALNAMHAEAQNNQGAIYSEMGRLDEARTSFNAAISANPGFVESHYNLSSLKTYEVNDPHLSFLEKIYARRNELAIPARIRYSFAIGKALDDVGRYDQAFAAYEEGNRLQRTLLPVNEESADRLLESVMQVFNSKFFEERKNWVGEVNQKRAPIFIVGMPRSGTTLLEQILSSHSSVYGAGELVDLNSAIYAATGQQDAEPYANKILSLSEEQVRKIGEDYLSRVWKLSPKSKFITDKMPANFFYLGIIHLALPNAKVIHAMRDPMDSCFSCYSRLFNDTMEFAYDLDSLGKYYRRYITLMKHWHKVLPKNTILDLSYEELVTDTEKQARRILEFVGLPWDEKCLDFHKNERLVKTASVAQVRKPIYKTSVARWKHFKSYLQPLLEQVREFRVNAEDDEVITSIAGSLSIGDPNQSRSLIERILHLQGQGQHQAVIDQLSIDILNLGSDPNIAIMLHLLGISFYRLNRFSESRKAYERALQIQPNFPSALNSLGFLLQDLGLLDQAKVAFERALELAPEMAMARLNLGMVQLKLGDFESGLENYEARWTGSAESAQGTFSKPECPLPLWNGEANIKNKSLLVITEQGFGDTFQFSRYLEQVGTQFKKVGFVCSAPTLRLMEWAFNHQITLFTFMPRDYSTWDYQCALMSLPRLCKTRLDSIPRQTPYLKVPEPVRLHWQDRLAKASPGRLRIGIAWAGRPVHQYDSRRSLRFEQILPLLQIPAITWVSLQKWTPQDVRPAIPANVDWIDWTDELQDFGDTAGLVENLDLIVSIDSSMIHLAGALNKPVWMLNRFDSEWRWLNQREDSPWYPSLRIFNQPTFGDWQSVIQTVGALLIGLPRANIPATLRPPTTPIEQVTKPNVVQTKNISTIEQALQLANQLQLSGRLTEAEQTLRGILQADPRQAHALHLLGVVTYQAGQPLLALDLVRQAIAVMPNAALFESNLAEMSRQQGRIQDAITHGKRAVEVDPTMASAHSNLGIALFDAKNYDAAEVAHQNALSLAPNLLQSLNNMGSIERARQNKAKALEWYRKALAINPEFLEALTNIGAVLVEEERPEEAVQPLLKVLNSYSNSPEALCNLGLAYFKLEDYEKAEDLLRRSLVSRPGYAEASIGLARVLNEVEKSQEAIQLLEDTLQKNPDKLDAWCLLGVIYTEAFNAEKAEHAYLKALEMDTGNADALTGLANLRLEAGLIDESEVLLNQALEKDPKNLGARFHLSQTKKVLKGDTNLAALEAMAIDINSLPHDKKISLHYALGKSYDDLGDFDKAFTQFSAGAQLKRNKLSYSAEADAARTDMIIETFTPEYFSRLQGSGNLSKSPIFVLGMPRSGTTLTEQIVASHSKVHGAGELHDFLEIAHNIPSPTKSFGYPDNISSLDADSLNTWGDAYIERTHKLGDKPFITDKMPANYMALGFIPLTLPNAKIIHVKRNPVDTCLSCYTRLFNRHQDPTYDLIELGKHYMNYVRIMEHWKAVLPADSFIEVQYEDIVRDMEGEAKRLIHSLGLKWEAACLDFYKNKRIIRTASVTQVRQPIYSSSVERWRHYEKHLGPLLKELESILP
ncbi:sulfotransferase [Polynucleobacter sp. Ross1-W9]|uniref:sulfotransferase n=1 Tax=Polynucleobacter parvulilacunae TaxID=1855631 RepID=UPI001C0C927C|nr:sulfotransferase [Polynucleobacter parvulilacunae]MBU3557625.1 sulfotransferase [Polynucleobacter parvulilacunae]